MATIHRGINGTEQKIRTYVQDYVHNEAQRHKKLVQKRPVNVCKGVFALILCVVALLCLIFIPGQTGKILDAVKNQFYTWGDRLMEGGLLSFLLGLVVGLVGLISPLLTLLVIYGVPLLLSAFIIMDLTFFDRDFDRVQCENQVLKQLPDEFAMEIYGLETEQKALDVLNHALNERCHIFTNVQVGYNGKTSETDCIVLSPRCITIIEIKGHKGIISGDLDDQKLIKTKASSQEAFYNPVRQCGTHVYRLGNYLRAKGANVTVQRCVWFFSEEATLQLTDRTHIGQSCPVFHGIDSALYRYVLGGNAPLSENTTDCIISALDWLIAHPPV